MRLPTCLIVAAFTLAGFVPCAFAEVKLAPDSSVQTVLERLHEVGKDLQTFTAKIIMRETDLISQDSSSRAGEAVYEQRPGGQTRFRVSFSTRTQDGLTQQQQIDYLLDKGVLIDRNAARKQEIRRQVMKPGEQINLLKLGEGPFPLPIGQTPDDVAKSFDVKRAEPSKEDPANSIHLTLTPKPRTSFARKFSSIDVWVDIPSGMPRRIDTVDTNGTMQRGTDLLQFKPNVPVQDSDFSLPQLPADWTRREEAYNE